MKILMSDDDSDDRMLAMLAFKKLNAAHSIDFVEDGLELMDYLTSRVQLNLELPDLILLDLNMPKKDGREALAEIRAHRKLKNLDIIIFTTSTLPQDRVYARELGVRNFIVKPRSQEELLRIFKQICDDLESKPGWTYSVNNVSKVRRQA